MSDVRIIPGVPRAKASKADLAELDASILQISPSVSASQGLNSHTISRSFDKQVMALILQRLRERVAETAARV